MGKSILELFKSKDIVTSIPLSPISAEEKYAVRNSKDIQLEPLNPLLKPAFGLQRTIRKRTSRRLRETLIEEELGGIKALMLLGGPVIYGTDLFRLKTKTTKMMDDLRAASNGSSTNGLLGGFVKKAESIGKNLLGKLGITFPEKLIPTRLVQNQQFLKGKENEIPDTLKKIKDNSKGSGLGRFLANNVKGGINEDMGKRLISSGITEVKKAAQKLLFGSRSEAGQNLVKSGGIYNSSALYSKSVDYTNTNITQRNDLSTLEQIYTKNNIKWKVPSNITLPYRTKLGRTSNVKPPRTYLPIFVSNFFNPSNNVTKIYSNPAKKAIHTSRGWGYGLKDDAYNKLKPGSAGGTAIDDLDFIPFKFKSLHAGTYLYFRATIKSINETFSPNWESKTFVGNPLPFYSYGHIERSVTINFTVFSYSLDEHIAAWARLADLARLAYPQAFDGSAQKVTAPFIELTIGDMFRDKHGFIESLTYTVPDNATWEIGMNGGQSDEYKAPHIIDVELQFKFLLAAQEVANEGWLYDFGNCGLPQGGGTTPGTTPNPPTAPTPTPAAPPAAPPTAAPTPTPAAPVPTPAAPPPTAEPKPTPAPSPTPTPTPVASQPTITTTPSPTASPTATPNAAPKPSPTPTPTPAAPPPQAAPRPTPTPTAPIKKVDPPTAPPTAPKKQETEEEPKVYTVVKKDEEPKPVGMQTVHYSIQREGSVLFVENNDIDAVTLGTLGSGGAVIRVWNKDLNNLVGDYQLLPNGSTHRLNGVTNTGSKYSSAIKLYFEIVSLPAGMPDDAGISIVLRFGRDIGNGQLYTLGSKSFYISRKISKLTEFTIDW